MYKMIRNTHRLSEATMIGWEGWYYFFFHFIFFFKLLLTGCQEWSNERRLSLDIWQCGKYLQILSRRRVQFCVRWILQSKTAFTGTTLPSVHISVILIFSKFVNNLSISLDKPTEICWNNQNENILFRTALNNLQFYYFQHDCQNKNSTQ